LTNVSTAFPQNPGSHTLSSKMAATTTPIDLDEETNSTSRPQSASTERGRTAPKRHVPSASPYGL